MLLSGIQWHWVKAFDQDSHEGRRKRGSMIQAPRVVKGLAEASCHRGTLFQIMGNEISRVTRRQS